MWMTRTAGAAVLAAIAFSGVPALASADPTTPAPADPAAPAPVTPTPGAPAPAAAPTPGAPTPAAAPKTTIDTDGTFAVGTDIVPGVYASAGPVGDGTCFWKRSGADGTTLDNALSKKPQTVQIDAGDQSFKTNGCQPWQLTDGAAPTPMTSPLLAGLQLRALMAQINANAAASGQAPPP
ncbi:MAG: hypothetical protein ABW137_18395 [Mycobacterium sp.]